MTQSKFPSVLWRGKIRAVMLAMLLSLLAGRGYGLGKFVVLTMTTQTDTTATCGNSNGSITVTSVMGGGTLPYQYSINGGLTFQSSPTFGNLAGGSYTIEVRDAATPTPNTGSVAVLMGDIPGPQIALQPFPASCANNDGQVDVIITGGTAPFLFAADAGPFLASNPVGGLVSGLQTITVKDANGCVAMESTFVPLNSNLTLLMGAGATICQGTDTPLTLTTNATAFFWSPSASLNDSNLSEPVASPAATTTYTLTASLGICVGTGTETVTVLPAPIPTATPSATTCYGQSVQLQGSGGVSYQWSPATYLSSTTVPDPVVQQPLKSVAYSLNVTGANGCTSIAPAITLVEVAPPPVVFAGDDTAVLVGQTLPLDAIDVNNTGFSTYQWSPAIGLDNPSIQDPVATITTDITYTVTATTPAGCLGTASIKILAVTMSDIVVPNAFTPNGDGHNDVFRVHAIGIKDFKYLRVFNRWGQQVFYGASEGAAWDGTVGGQAQPMGTYVWMTMGLDFSGRVVERRGTVILVR
jgi:gliding motility-associated-like protein